MPLEPPASPWDFGDLRRADPHDDVIGRGADLEPGTLLHAYRSGLFPMPEGGDRGALLWFCPVRRGVLPLDGLVVSRSLRRSLRDVEIRVDTAFEEVVAACGDPGRDRGWITAGVATAYGELHRLGWAHSVEAWRAGELVGGLYGVAIGGLFAGESMFHRRRDASKAALVGLVELLSDEHVADRLLDVQWRTPHLATLGTVEITRTAYLDRLDRSLGSPLPRPWQGSSGTTHSLEEIQPP